MSEQTERDSNAGVVSAESQVREAFAENLARIGSEQLRDQVAHTWVRVMELASVADLRSGLASVSFIEGHEQPGEGIAHVNGIAAVSFGIATALVQWQGATIDFDVLMAGALLCDVGKLLERAPRSETTPLAGDLVSHAFSGMHIATEVGLPAEVLHIIAYHAFEGARRKRSHECEIVHRADMIDVDAITRRVLGKPGDKLVPYVYLP
jgi:putative nucleotidyltransferase with HDIG domain